MLFVVEVQETESDPVCLCGSGAKIIPLGNIGVGKVEKLSTATLSYANVLLQMERVTETINKEYFFITYSDNFIIINMMYCMLLFK